MRIFSKFFDVKIFEEKLQHLNNIDFSLFVDDLPGKQEDLSSINILVLQEPNEYFGMHDYAIQNKHLFSFILTWNDKVINSCENTIFLPFGHTWFKPDQYEKNHQKEFKISHLCGTLLKSYGHQMRHEILDRENEFKVPTQFYKTIGNRHNIEDARIGKETVFGNTQYGIAIENFSHRGYFTEKILDCFLLKTIPVYWGCSSISSFFKQEGIITFNNIDDLIFKINQLDKNYYNEHLDIINENYQLALQYVDYEQNIVNKITEIFKYNELIQ